ncbi:MAG: response regulator [Candidatus Omnitrophica bacterium]|nr:response regulator [Candidatus Omnitrophota bacterium]MCM8827155.1 response regulator [Candidatus Omnitrophota bacterium]
MGSISSTFKILVVDDEERIVEYLSYVLSSAGYEVISTTKGSEAINLAKIHKPDLIILDMVMPEIRGEEVVRILKDNPLVSRIPIIYFTGVVSKKDEEFIKKLTGKYGILTKPTTKDKLLEAVRSTLGR